MSGLELRSDRIFAHTAERRVDVPERQMAPNAAQAPAMPPLRERVQAAAEQIDSYLKNSNRELEFQVDEQSGAVVVRVRDPATGDVIRQIPGEEVLRMARALQENTPVLVDLTV